MITRVAITWATIRVLTIWLMISSELATNRCPHHWAGGNLGDYQSTGYRADIIVGD